MGDGNEVWSGVVLTPDERAQYDEPFRRPVTTPVRYTLSVRYADGREEERSSWVEHMTDDELRGLADPRENTKGEQ